MKLRVTYSNTSPGENARTAAVAATSSVSAEHAGSLNSVTITADTGPSAVVGAAVYMTASNPQGMSVSTGPYAEYDPEFHEIEWTWEISGLANTTFQSSARIANGLNDRTVDWGQRAFFIPDQAGTYTVTLTGRDDSGNVCQGTAQIVVSSYDSLASAANTIILYDGADLTGAPSHDVGNRYTSVNDAINAFNSASLPRRLCILGGQTYDAAGSGARIEYPSAGGTQIIDTYGTGQASITNKNNGLLRLTGTNPAASNTVVRNIACDGTWSSASETYSGADPGSYYSSFGSGHDNVRTSFYNCTASGYSECYILQSRGQVYIEDSNITDWIEYGVYMGQSSDHRVGLRGVAIDKPSLASAGGKRNDDGTDTALRSAHGPLRINDPNPEAIVSRCSFWSPSAWTYNSGAEFVAAQPAIRWRQDELPGGHLQLIGCTVDGNVGIEHYNEQTPANALVERCVVMSGNWAGTVDLYQSGTTVRNNFLIGPDASRPPGAGSRAECKIVVNSEIGSSPTNTDPVRIYGNTIVDLGTGDFTMPFGDGIDIVSAFPDQTIENNVSYGPNFTTPHQPDGAMTAVTGAAPLNGGAYMNWTNHQIVLGSDLNLSASLLEIPYWSDLDDVLLTQATFSGTLGAHYLKTTAILGYSAQYYDVTASFSATGVTLTNNDSGSRVIPAGTYYVQLDRRHNPAGIIPSSASPANSGQVWRPNSTITADPGLLPVLDFYGNVRTGQNKGALEPL